MREEETLELWRRAWSSPGARQIIAAVARRVGAHPVDLDYALMRELEVDRDVLDRLNSILVDVIKAKESLDELF